MSELLLLATIADCRCALRAEDVQSVIETGAITPIPCAPAQVTGLSALRSQALTVIDCRRALGFDPVNFSTDTRAAVVSVGGHTYALQVDIIEDIAAMAHEAAEVSGGFGKAWSQVAEGMIETAAGPALLLNVAALIEGTRDSGAEAA